MPPVICGCAEVVYLWQLDPALSKQQEKGQHKWARELWRPLSVTQLCAHDPQDSYVLGMVTATNISIPLKIHALVDALAERS